MNMLTPPPCADEPELFFPISYEGPAAQAQIQSARDVCYTQCPYLDTCLRYALASKKDDHGIFAGTTPDQRQSLRKALLRKGRLAA